MCTGPFTCFRPGLPGPARPGLPMGRARAPVWALAWAPDPAPGPIQAPAPGAPLGVDVPAALSAQAGGPQRVPVPADPLAADAPLEGAAVPAAVPLGAGVLLAEADAPAAVPSGAGAAADAGDPALRWLPARAQRSSGYPLWGQTKVCPLFFASRPPAHDGFALRLVTLCLFAARGFTATRAKPAPAVRRLGFPPRCAPSARLTTAPRFVLCFIQNST